MKERVFRNYLNHLQVERGLAPNTIEAYQRVIQQFLSYLISQKCQVVAVGKPELSKYVYGIRSHIITLHVWCHRAAGFCIVFLLLLNKKKIVKEK